MTEEQQHLVKWFKQQRVAGLSYDEAQELLISYRTSSSRSEVKTYETFAYMFDEEWFEVMDLFKDM